MISALSHITVAVSNVEESLHFYAGYLGFQLLARWNSGAYLEAGGIWLCLSLDEPCPGKDYSHVAFRVDVESLDRYRNGLERHGVIQWKTNTSEGDSLYLLDPDGHKLELHVGDLESRLESLKTKPYEGLQWSG